MEDALELMKAKQRAVEAVQNGKEIDKERLEVALMSALTDPNYSNAVGIVAARQLFAELRGLQQLEREARRVHPQQTEQQDKWLLAVLAAIEAPPPPRWYERLSDESELEVQQDWLFLRRLTYPLGEGYTRVRYEWVSYASLTPEFRSAMSTSYDGPIFKDELGDRWVYSARDFPNHRGEETRLAIRWARPVKTDEKGKKGKKDKKDKTDERWRT